MKIPYSTMSFDHPKSRIYEGLSNDYQEKYKEVMNLILEKGRGDVERQGGIQYIKHINFKIKFYIKNAEEMNSKNL